ncbi:MAG: hypothetical protein ACLTMR_11345 [Faecalibacillus sp.]
MLTTSCKPAEQKDKSTAAASSESTKYIAVMILLLMLEYQQEDPIGILFPFNQGVIENTSKELVSNCTGA